VSRFASSRLSSRLAHTAAAFGLAAVTLWGGAVRAEIRVAELGGFHVGGETVSVDGADYVRGQAYVQLVRLTRPKGRYPLLLWHGGSMTGAVYERTPDGRPGWLSDFLAAGYSVAVVDTFSAGRAGFADYPRLSPEPAFRPKDFAWEVFRIGPPGSYASDAAARRAYPDTLFPTAWFDAFGKGIVPRFPTDFEKAQSTYRQVLERVCPCVLVTHSASGPIGFALAARHPELVRGLVSVEPSGGPAVPSPPTRVPHLVLWGDHLDAVSERSNWPTLYASARAYLDRAKSVGAPVTWADLPARGVRGNSHMLMSDSNSADIAGVIDGWVRKTVR